MESNIYNIEIIRKKCVLFIWLMESFLFQMKTNDVLIQIAKVLFR